MMNTPESDQAQIEYARNWLMRKQEKAKRRARKRLEKQEKKLLRTANQFFGYEVRIKYEEAQHESLHNGGSEN